jgi:hypothetical protein
MKRIFVIGYLATAVIGLTIFVTMSFVAPKENQFTKEQIQKGYVIIPTGEIDPDTDRPFFNVILPDGKTLENMYAEEIALSLMSGKWQYDDTWELVRAEE